MAVEGIRLNLKIALGSEGPDAPEAAPVGLSERLCLAGRLAGRERAIRKSDIGLKVARFRLATFTLRWRAGIRLEAEDVNKRLYVEGGRNEGRAGRA